MNLSPETNQAHASLKSRGFIALLVTMACGAFNDNIYRGMLMLAVASGGLWATELGDGGTGWITTMLYAPFVLLLGVAGVVADRSPKRRIILITRLVELGLAAGVIVAMLLESLPLACLLLIGFASQSAFFSPAKYGIVPDLVGEERLSRANGLLSLLSNASIVGGLAIAGWFLEIGEQINVFGGVLIGIVMAVVALISFFVSLMLPKLPAGEPDLPMSFNFVKTYWRTLKSMRGTGLLAVATAWCMFYAVGSLLINVIPYYGAMLDLTSTEVGGLLGIVTVGIAIGGVTAGFSSGDRIRAGLAPMGAFGIGICSVLLGFMGDSYVNVLVLLAILGFCGGFFVVPILAMLQHVPVPGFRARCVGTANFLTFLAMTITSLAYSLLASWVGVEPPRWFFIAAGFMFVVVIWMLFLLPALHKAARPESFSSVSDEAWS